MSAVRKKSRRPTNLSQSSFSLAWNSWTVFFKTSLFYSLYSLFFPPNAMALNFDIAFEKGWLYLFPFVFFAGVLTSFTPCIFPMVPITLSLIGTKKAHSRFDAFLLSFSYVLGIGLIYSLLGIMAAATGSLFGSLLGHPITKISFSLLFILLAFSLFGWFEMRTPRLIEEKLNHFLNLHQKKNIKWVIAFLSGGVAGIVASPCVGPVLASLLLYVSQSKNLLTGFLLLLTFSLGLGQIFLLLGTFSQWTLPKMGVWMKRLKYLLGVILLAMAWNFTFPFFNQENLFSRLFLFLPQANNKEEKIKAHLKNVKEELVYGYQWVKFSPPHLAKAKKDGKPVIIDFFADWCEACHKLEKKTFNQKKVKLLGENFLWMKIDVTHPSEKQRNIMKGYEILGLPSVLFYSPSGRLEEDLTLKGFEKEEHFLKRMKKVLQR